jgi:hypothetical protein
MCQPSCRRHSSKNVGRLSTYVHRERLMSSVMEAGAELAVDLGANNLG